MYIYGIDAAEMAGAIVLAVTGEERTGTFVLDDRMYELRFTTRFGKTIVELGACITPEGISEPNVEGHFEFIGSCVTARKESNVQCIMNAVIGIIEAYNAQ